MVVESPQPVTEPTTGAAPSAPPGVPNPTEMPSHAADAAGTLVAHYGALISTIRNRVAERMHFRLAPLYMRISYACGPKRAVWPARRS
jgi:hypothetical protein